MRRSRKQPGKGLIAAFFASFCMVAPLALTPSQAVIVDDGLTVSHTFHIYGSFPLTGGPSEPMWFTVANNSLETATILSAELVGEDANSYQIAGSLDLPYVIPSGEAFHVGVLFVPRTARIMAATLRITTDSSTSPEFNISLTGIGFSTPSIANPDNYQGTENELLEVPPPGVLGNDLHPDGQPAAMSAVLQDPPGNAAAFQLNADGSFAYLPSTGFFGIDSFTYRVFDGFALSSVATVALDIQEAEAAPTLDFASTSLKAPSNSRLIPITVSPGETGKLPDYIEISEDPNFSTFTRIAYTGQTVVYYELSDGDGERIIYVRLSNQAGESDIQSVAVTIDTTPPSQHPSYLLSLLDAPSTAIDNVSLRFLVGFTEPVYTSASGNPTAGLQPSAVQLGGTAKGLPGLSIAVFPSLGRNVTGDVYEIHVTGAVTEAGDLSVGLIPEAIQDAAGNVMTSAGPSASISLATWLEDWRAFE